MKRRTFLKQTATAAAGATLLPACNIRRSGSAFSLNNLNVACVGTGRMGNAAVEQAMQENLVALCDVDWRTDKKVWLCFPAY